MIASLPDILTIESEQEDDGRWIAEILELPGVLVYGSTQQGAIAHVQALALRVIADKLEHGELEQTLTHLEFNAA
jgi:predicted RNase H-like HicB family nuclease